MRKAYRAAMECLYIVCIRRVGRDAGHDDHHSLGVFMRYWVESPASWPEPAGHPADGPFSFIGGGAAYRARRHIAVSTLPQTC